MLIKFLTNRLHGAIITKINKRRCVTMQGAVYDSSIIAVSGVTVPVYFLVFTNN